VPYNFHLASRKLVWNAIREKEWVSWWKNHRHLSRERRFNTWGHINSNNVFGVTGSKLEEVDPRASNLRLAEEQLAMNYCLIDVISCLCRSGVQWRTYSRSQWRRGLKRGSVAAELSGIAGSNPGCGHECLPCKCYVLSGTGFCGGPIPRPEESYRVFCVSVEFDQVRE
jgi:hypothetical protein